MKDLIPSNTISETSTKILRTKSFQNFVRTGAEKWLEVIQDWVLYSVELYVVMYEVGRERGNVKKTPAHFDVQELTENPIGELKRLLHHLRVEIEPGRLDCIDRHSEGSFHRTNSSKTGEDPFTQELHTLLDTNIQTADTLLWTVTGRGLPLTKYHYYNGQSV